MGGRYQIQQFVKNPNEVVALVYRFFEMHPNLRKDLNIIARMLARMLVGKKEDLWRRITNNRGLKKYLLTTDMR
jgi:hypothetical protein